MLLITDDTDIFVLGVFFLLAEDCQANVMMQATHAGRSVISIGAAVRKHQTIAPSLLGIHALTECDSVCRLFGTGKKKAVSIASKKELTLLGEIDADINDVINEVTEFNGLCGGMSEGATISDKR